jgi:hypothetical protein
MGAAIEILVQDYHRADAIASQQCAAARHRRGVVPRFHKIIDANQWLGYREGARGTRRPRRKENIGLDEHESSALKELEPARLNGFSNTRLHSRRSPEHDREFMTW